MERWLPVTVTVVIALATACCSTSTATTEKKYKEHARNSVTLQGPHLEKVAEGPVKNLSGCHLTLHFKNENVGWAYCLNQLWGTKDGGANWHEVFKRNGDNFSVYAFGDSNIVFARTLYELYRSDDEGFTWKAMPTPNLGGETTLDSMETLDSIEFLKDGLHGWLTASKFVSCSSEVREKLGVHSLSFDGKKCLEGYIFYTEDSGKSWRRQPFPSQLGSSIGLQITRDGRVWAFHNLQVFYFAAGQWKKINYTKGQCEHKSVLKILRDNENIETHGPIEIFFTGKIGWLSFSNGYLAKSTDDGKTWCDLFKPESLDQHFEPRFSKLYFSDENNGWGLADRIFRTKDGGVSWEKIETGMEIDDMYFLDADHGWAISKEGLFAIRR